MLEVCQGRRRRKEEEGWEEVCGFVKEVFGFWCFFRVSMGFIVFWGFGKVVRDLFSVFWERRGCVVFFREKSWRFFSWRSVLVFLEVLEIFRVFPIFCEVLDFFWMFFFGRGSCFFVEECLCWDVLTFF